MMFDAFDDAVHFILENSSDENRSYLANLKFNFIEALTTDTSLTAADIAVGVVMATRFFYRFEGCCHPSLDTIAARTGRDKRTVRRAIRKLAPKYLLIRESTGRGRSNEYTIPFKNWDTETIKKEDKPVPLNEGANRFETVPKGSKRGTSLSLKGGEDCIKEDKLVTKGGRTDPPNPSLNPVLNPVLNAVAISDQIAITPLKENSKEDFSKPGSTEPDRTDGALARQENGAHFDVEPFASKPNQAEPKQISLFDLFEALGLDDDKARTSLVEKLWDLESDEYENLMTACHRKPPEEIARLLGGALAIGREAAE